MMKSHRTLMIAVLVVFVFGGVVGAQERVRNGEIRGVFVRLTERQVDERGYMGIVVRPFEKDEHNVVLVPREYEDLARSARSLREGDRLEISFVTEHGEMWIKGIEAVRRREEGDREREGGRRIEIRREEIRRGPERMEERREGEMRMEFRREVGREPERERMEGRREGERRIVIRREGERGPEIHREERMRREPPPHEHLEIQLRDVIAGHMERMGMELKEVLAFHIGRMHEEMQELRMHAENMRREIEKLRHQNEMLRRQLRERGEPRRESGRERLDRDVHRDREHDQRREAERREQREREEQEVRRDRDRE